MPVPFLMGGSTMNWLFTGVHGAILEASLVVSVTAGITDMISQSGEITVNKIALKKIEEKRQREEDLDSEEEEVEEQGWEWIRVGRVCIIGSVYGPLEYGYFYLLQMGLPWWQQVLIDNFVVTPLIYTGGIIMNMGLRDGNFDRLCDEWPTKFMEMFLVGLPLWLIMDTLTFTVIPLRHRVPFTRIGGFFFNIYCMHVLNGPRDKDDPAAYPRPVENVKEEPELPPQQKTEEEEA